MFWATKTASNFHNVTGTTFWRKSYGGIRVAGHCRGCWGSWAPERVAGDGAFSDGLSSSFWGVVEEATTRTKRVQKTPFQVCAGSSRVLEPPRQTASENIKTDNFPKAPGLVFVEGKTSQPSLGVHPPSASHLRGRQRGRKGDEPDS